jgi:hypothetical protein
LVAISSFYSIQARLCQDHQPRHLDDALEAVDGALDEFRKANAAFYIENAERLRGKILPLKGDPKNRAAKK